MDSYRYSDLNIISYDKTSSFEENFVCYFTDTYNIKTVIIFCLMSYLIVCN